MSKQYNKPGHSEGYKAKICLGMILEFLRAKDPTGEGGTSIKEIGLLEFQQRIGGKITPDDLVDQIEYSQNKRAVEKRKYREGLKQKQDYENLLKEMKEKARRK